MIEKGGNNSTLQVLKGNIQLILVIHRVEEIVNSEHSKWYKYQVNTGLKSIQFKLLIVNRQKKLEWMPCKKYYKYKAGNGARCMKEI